MFSVTTKGDFKNTLTFIRRVLSGQVFSKIDNYGLSGVEALAAATPVKTGLTAASWHYRIIKDSKHIAIEWYNDNLENTTPIAILLQYGHGTGTGGYVLGRDYINPALRPIFDRITEDVWMEVTA